MTVPVMLLTSLLLRILHFYLSICFDLLSWVLGFCTDATVFDDLGSLGYLTPLFGPFTCVLFVLAMILVAFLAAFFLARLELSDLCLSLLLEALKPDFELELLLDLGMENPS